MEYYTNAIGRRRTFDICKNDDINDKRPQTACKVNLNMRKYFVFNRAQWGGPVFLVIGHSGHK